jgi:hypothetical protein
VVQCLWFALPQPLFYRENAMSLNIVVTVCDMPVCKDPAPEEKLVKSLEQYFLSSDNIVKPGKIRTVFLKAEHTIKPGHFFTRDNQFCITVTGLEVKEHKTRAYLEKVESDIQEIFKDCGVRGTPVVAFS